MNIIEKVEKHFSIEFTDTWVEGRETGKPGKKIAANDYAHYIYEDTTADGYYIYISTNDPNNIIVEENVFYLHDSDIFEELLGVLIDEENKIDPGSKIYINMDTCDGEDWLEVACDHIVESLDL